MHHTRHPPPCQSGPPLVAMATTQRPACDSGGEGNPLPPPASPAPCGLGPSAQGGGCSLLGTWGSPGLLWPPAPWSSRCLDRESPGSPPTPQRPDSTVLGGGVGSPAHLDLAPPTARSEPLLGVGWSRVSQTQMLAGSQGSGVLGRNWGRCGITGAFTPQPQARGDSRWPALPLPPGLTREVAREWGPLGRKVRPHWGGWHPPAPAVPPTLP